jgi:hypothetical protein
MYWTISAGSLSIGDISLTGNANLLLLLEQNMLSATRCFDAFVAQVVLSFLWGNFLGIK